MAEQGVTADNSHRRLPQVDRYRDALSQVLVWRRDWQDVTDEATDHLYLATEKLIREGVEPDEAQRRALDRFGDVRSVAVSFATTRSGGVALPTRFTQYAGAIGLAVASAWIAWSLFLVAGGAVLLLDPTTIRVVDPFAFVGVTTLNFVALPASCLALAGLLRRAGATWRDPGMVLAAALGVLGPVIALITWHVFWPAYVDGRGATYGWVPWLVMSLLGAITFVAVVRLRALGASCGPADLLLVGSWPLAMVLRQVGIWLGPDQTMYGIECPGQAVMLLGLGPLLFALGLIGRSRWLATESAQVGGVAGLDLRWAVPGVVGMVLGVASVTQFVGYLASELAGRSGFLFAALPGPAVTALLVAAVGFGSGRLALVRARGRSATGTFV